jgi:hypothetical protein
MTVMRYAMPSHQFWKSNCCSAAVMTEHCVAKLFGGHTLHDGGQYCGKANGVPAKSSPLPVQGDGFVKTPG